MSFPSSTYRPDRKRTAAKGAANELRDLDCERVDGVDRPATGRSFMLFKSEDGAGRRLMRKVASTSGFMLPELVTAEPNRPPQGYVFAEPDADARGPADMDLGGDDPEDLEDRDFKGLFTNIVFGVPPKTQDFPIEDQPARQPERRNDRSIVADFSDADPIPAGGAGPTYSADGKQLFRPAAAAQFPDGRVYVTKADPDRTFRTSMTSAIFG